MNSNSDLVKEIKEYISLELYRSARVSPAMQKSFDLFDGLLVALNGLCCKYSLSHDDHRIIVHVFPAVSYPERTFTIDATAGTIEASFIG